MCIRDRREDGHVDVASAIRKCKTTIEDAGQLLSKLQTMDPEGGLPSWWNSKLTIAANSMNKLRDYILNPVQENVIHEAPGDLEDMKKIVAELEKASKMHLGQSKRIAAHIGMMSKSEELDEEPYVNTKSEYLVLIDKDNKIVAEFEGKDALKDAKDSVRSAHLPPMRIPKNEVGKMKVYPISPKDKKDIGDMVLAIGEEVELDEALKPSDKKVVDAFYDGKSMKGDTLSTDGKKLEKSGLGAQTIATSSGSKFKIVANMDGRHTQSVVAYIKKSFPKNVVELNEQPEHEAQHKKIHHSYNYIKKQFEYLILQKINY